MNPGIIRFRIAAFCMIFVFYKKTPVEVCFKCILFEGAWFIGQQINLIGRIICNSGNPFRLVLKAFYIKIPVLIASVNEMASSKR